MTLVHGNFCLITNIGLIAEEQITEAIPIRICVTLSVMPMSATKILINVLIANQNAIAYKKEDRIWVFLSLKAKIKK